MLRQFIVSFDQKNRRVRFQAQAEGPVRLPPERGTGAVFRQKPDGLEIARILAGSPAEKAGLRVGDLVVAVNGVPILERGCQDMDASEKESLDLALLRDGKKLQISVGIVDLIP
ncbi:MAG: PDZ domain-containing protein [Acidobacteriota bacterium]